MYRNKFEIPINLSSDFINEDYQGESLKKCFLYKFEYNKY